MHSRSIHEDFRTFEIVQKAKRGELQDHMKTKNADSRHGRVVDLSEPLPRCCVSSWAAERVVWFSVNQTAAN